MGANRKAAICAMVMGCTLLRTGVPSAAAQQRGGLQLRWQAPAGCPQESAVRDRIRALVPSGEPDLHLRADGTITQTDGRFRLKLVVTDGHSSGERIIESTSCAELAGAAAVALRLLMRVGLPEAAPSGSEHDVRGNPASAPAHDAGSKSPNSPASGASQPAAPASSVATAAQPATAPPPRAPAPTPSASSLPAAASPSAPASASMPPPTNDELPLRRWWALLRAPLVAGDAGPLPSTGVGVGLAVGLKLDSWRFLVSGRVSPSQRIEANDFPGYGVDVERATGELFSCRGIRGDRFELSPCLALGVERLTARGFGAHIVPETRHPISLGAGAALVGYWYPWDWMALFVNIEGRIQASRPNVALEQIGNVFQIAPAVFTLAVGTEWIL